MNASKHRGNTEDNGEWEYKEEVFATYHIELPRMTALMKAALRGQLTKVRLLLMAQNKASIFQKDDHGNTAMHYAVQGGNIEIIKLFLKKGLEINETGGGGWSPLMTAVNEAYSGKSFPNGNDEVIKFLLDNGASVNYQDDGGETALMLAVESETDSDSDMKIIRLLIEHGADVNLKNSEGETALDKAVDYENKTVAEYLVAKGAKAGQSIPEGLKR